MKRIINASSLTKGQKVMVVGMSRAPKKAVVVDIKDPIILIRFCDPIDMIFGVDNEEHQVDIRTTPVYDFDDWTNN